MNALVYHGPGKKSWDAVPDPVIQKATDAIVSIDTRPSAAQTCTS